MTNIETVRSLPGNANSRKQHVGMGKRDVEERERKSSVVVGGDPSLGVRDEDENRLKE